MTAPRLTRRLLNAMDSALAFILAGEIEEEEEAPAIEDYRRAQAWVWHQLEKRETAGSERPAVPCPPSLAEQGGNQTQRGR